MTTATAGKEGRHLGCGKLYFIEINSYPHLFSVSAHHLDNIDYLRAL